jgi:hypothetical protein
MGESCANGMPEFQSLIFSINSLLSQNGESLETLSEAINRLGGVKLMKTDNNIGVKPGNSPTPEMATQLDLLAKAIETFSSQVSKIRMLNENILRIV